MNADDATDTMRMARLSLTGPSAARAARRSGEHSGSGQIHHFDPVRAPFGRILCERLKLTTLRIDAINAEAVRHLADSEQEATVRRDVETARLSLGRPEADQTQASAGAIDRAAGKRVRTPLAGEEATAIRCQVNVGRRRHASEVRRQYAESLQEFKPGLAGLAPENMRARVEFVDEINEGLMGGECKVPQPRLGRQLLRRLAILTQHAGSGVEGEAEDLKSGKPTNPIIPPKPVAERVLGYFRDNSQASCRRFPSAVIGTLTAANRQS